MDPNTRPDVITTMAGGASGMGLLATVRWELIPHGEVLKIAVAFFLLWSGYAMYRRGLPK